MKNLILIVILLSFFNCAMPIDSEWYDCIVPTELKTFYPVYTEESQVAFWVNYNIKYKLYANGFHSAKQTLNEMKGNCANKALTTIALWYQITGQKGQLIYCWYNNGKISGLHYAAKINGYIVEGKDIITIYETVNFDNIAEYIYYRQ